MGFKYFIFVITLLGLHFSTQAYEPPTMGWSSWNTYRVNISDSLIRRQAKAMLAKGLKMAGYNYINIDDGFFGGRDKNGQLLIHSKRFPKGLKNLVDYIHSLGFKAGIYSDAGRNTCGSFWDKDKTGIGVGFYGHDKEDANFYFKENGFDFIKIDFCGGDEKQNFDSLELNEKERYTTIRQAIDAIGKSNIRINICRWAFPGTWVHDVGSSWRIAPDISPHWNSIKAIISRNRYLSAYATEGCFNDMDILEIGRGLSKEEERTHFGMWCILSSPLLIGCDIITIPEYSLKLIKNPELIALNQDPLALQAYIADIQNGVYLYIKDIEEFQGNTRAIAIYNPTDQTQTFTINTEKTDLEGPIKIRDLFRRTDLPNITKDSFSIIIAPHDTRIFRIEGQHRLERTDYEAETAWLETYQELENPIAIGTAYYADAVNCSCGAKAVQLGGQADNYIEWRNIYSKKGGKYALTVHYTYPEKCSFICNLNGSDIKQLTVEPSPREGIATCTLQITLKKGVNKIRLHNPNAPCPDIDKITLIKQKN